MPRKSKGNILEIGGKSTDYGYGLFVEKQMALRKEILSKSPRYRDITESVMAGDCIPGDSTNNAAKIRKNRKGKVMPAKISNSSVVSRRSLNGNRGRKALFNHHDFEMDLNEILDVTEEMSAGISDYIANRKNKDEACDDFTLADLFAGEIKDANSYRSSRFSALKTAATKKNGADTKYALEIATREATDADDNEELLDNSGNVQFWALVRTA